MTVYMDAILKIVLNPMGLLFFHGINQKFLIFNHLKRGVKKFKTNILQGTIYFALLHMSFIDWKVTKACSLCGKATVFISV